MFKKTLSTPSSASTATTTAVVRGEETLKKASLAYYKNHRFDLFRRTHLNATVPFATKISPINNINNVTNATAATATIDVEPSFNATNQLTANEMFNSKRATANNSVLSLNSDLCINKIKLKNKYKEFEISSNSSIQQQHQQEDSTMSQFPQLQIQTVKMTTPSTTLVSAFTAGRAMSLATESSLPKIPSK